MYSVSFALVPKVVVTEHTVSGERWIESFGSLMPIKKQPTEPEEVRLRRILSVQRKSFTLTTASGTM